MNNQQTITTTLVHKRENTEVPWWHSTVVCDLPGSFDNDDLQRLAALIPKLAHAGFDALLLRPANPMVETGLSDLSKFITHAHRFDLKVVVRVFVLPEGEVLDPTDSPPLLVLSSDTSLLIDRVKAALNAGADGIDLGSIMDDPGDPDAAAHALAFTRTVQIQLAELEERQTEAILTAAVSRVPHEFYLRHLTEDWFHHTRGDALIDCAWNPKRLQQAVRSTYRDHDPLGHTVAWRHSLPRWSDSPVARDSADIGWSQGAGEERQSAMNLFVASLPGAAYLPFLSTGGELSTSRGKRTKLKFKFGEGRANRHRLRVVQEALTIRRRLNLGESSLAFLRGLEWADDSVAVHLTGSTMVVLNTGEDEIVVPSKYQLLITSEGMAATEPDGTVVPPETCAWFHAPGPSPVDPGTYR